jgi:hypothetical protein
MRSEAQQPGGTTVEPPAMVNPMPLSHAARRTRRNREEGNPFATDRVIAERIEELTAAYLRCRNARTANLLKVEIDLLETLI